MFQVTLFLFCCKHVIVSKIMNFIINIFIVSILGILIRQSLHLTKQTWASTYQQLATFSLLPAITFTVTKAISGDIALALGMVGALSIVRFRNPVRNTFELVNYFALITIGITSAVNIKYGIALSLFIILVVFLTNYLNQYMQKNNNNFFSLSFSEGEVVNTLEVKFIKKIDENFDKTNLIEEIIDNENNEFIYKFASRNKSEIENLKKELEKLETKNIIINYS